MPNTEASALDRPIVFFGTEELSLLVLQKIVEAGYPIAAVVTKPDLHKGRGKKTIAPPVKVFAEEHGIDVWQPHKLSEITDKVTVIQPAVGVLVSFGRIIPQGTLDLFSPGVINIHPSLLPKYRGPSPIETAILNNDTETGVTIMQLSAAMDAGPLYVQKAINLNQYRDTHGVSHLKENLYTSLGLLGAELLIRSLPGIVSGDIIATEQDESKATYCQMITKQDGVIDWSKPAERITLEVDAYRGWPGSTTAISGIAVRIINGSAVYPVRKESNIPGTVFVDAFQLKQDGSDYPLLYVSAGSNTEGLQTYYQITRLQPAGKKEMSARDFINGYRHLLQDLFIA
ncbi:MAG: methionyl-tRNA formyltransferase [Candidatus Microsaccharimonas sp.]